MSKLCISLKPAIKIRWFVKILHVNVDHCFIYVAANLIGRSTASFGIEEGFAVYCTEPSGRSL